MNVLERKLNTTESKENSHKRNPKDLRHSKYERMHVTTPLMSVLNRSFVVWDIVLEKEKKLRCVNIQCVHPRTEWIFSEKKALTHLYSSVWYMPTSYRNSINSWFLFISETNIMNLSKTNLFECFIVINGKWSFNESKPGRFGALSKLGCHRNP